MKDVLVGGLQVRDVARHLLLTGGDLGGELVHTLLHCDETSLELQQFGRKGGGRGRRDYAGSRLRNDNNGGLGIVGSARLPRWPAYCGVRGLRPWI